MKYIILYTENTTPKKATFNNKDEILPWVLKFYEENLGDDGSWVDRIFYGECIYGASDVS